MINKAEMKKKFTVVVILMLTFVSTFALVELNSREKDLDDRSQAQNTASTQKLWSFGIIGDTQAKPDQYTFEKAFPKLIAQEPEMLFHVGDFSFGYLSDHPKKGMIDVQLWKKRKYGEDVYPVEIHVAPGNHDDGSEGSLYGSYINSFCFGIHRTGQETYTTEGEYPPFNPVIPNVPGYCSKNPPSNNLQYVFSRANIRFIMLDMPFYSGSKSKKQWFKEQICADNDQSITIAFTHESRIDEDDNDFIHFVRSAQQACPDNNLAAMFTGHEHNFKHVHDEQTDVHFVRTNGMYWIRTNKPGLTNDFLYADVYSDRIEFFRSMWRSTEPDYGPPRKFLTINGEFEDYIHPNDPSANLTTQMMTIPKGLNIVTFPLDRDGGAAKLMESVEGSGATISSIANFNSGSWEIYKKIGQDYTGTNFDIDAQTGYFVLSDREVTFEWEGYQGVQDPELELTQGWNLVKAGDFYTDAQEMVTELAQGEEYGYVSVFIYEDGQYKGVIHDGGVYGHTFALQEGEAYFVRVEKEAAEPDNQD